MKKAIIIISLLIIVGGVFFLVKHGNDSKNTSKPVEQQKKDISDFKVTSKDKYKTVSCEQVDLYFKDLVDSGNITEYKINDCNMVECKKYNNLIILKIDYDVTFPNKESMLLDSGNPDYETFTVKNKIEYFSLYKDSDPDLESLGNEFTC